jgi:predicted site-specific integrase-resolvase
MAYVPLREAVKRLGLHSNTLRKYADNGKIESIKNEAGQRLFNVESYLRGAADRSLVCYCRVSSTKQRDDLGRQIAYMQSLVVLVRLDFGQEKTLCNLAIFPSLR